MISKQYLQDYMSANKGLLSSCKKQEILEFNTYFIGIQHLFCLVHKLYIMIIDKRFNQEQISILQKEYIDVHLKDKLVKIIFQETFYTEGSLNKMYEEQKQLIIQKYSEQNFPILGELDQELKMLEPDQCYNLQSLNIPDQFKLQYTIQQENLHNNELFAQKLNLILSSYDSRLENFIAVQTQKLCVQVNLLNIQIFQYWLLLTQYEQHSQRGNQTEKETVIKKHKDVYYFVIINGQFLKLQMTQQQLELLVYQCFVMQFDQFVESVKQQEQFDYLKIEQPLNDITVKAEYFQFRDCTFRIVQKLDIETIKTFYCLEILGVQGLFYQVFECDYVQLLQSKLDAFQELNISKIINGAQTFNKYFIQKIDHNIPKNCDPKFLTTKIKFGSILLTDKFMFQHAALYLGCDLVFHYSQQQGDNVKCSFKPERFDNYMKETTQVTELQLIFILRNKQELIEKAVEKSAEILQSSLINNYENLAFEVITNYKGSNSIDFNTIKNLGVGLVQLFKIGSKQIQQE